MTSNLPKLMYLNPALQGKGTFARRMSLTYKGTRGGLRDMKADFAGIDIGTNCEKVYHPKQTYSYCNL